MLDGAVDGEDAPELDAISGGGGEEPTARGETPGGDLNLDQLMTAAEGDHGGEGDAGAIPLEGERTAAEGGTVSQAPTQGVTSDYPQLPQFGELQPPPPPPALSADPAENTRRMVQWQRDLVAHHNEVTNRQVALNDFTAKVAATKGAKEAQLSAAKAEAVRLEAEKAATRRAQAQAAIDAAVQDRIESKRNLESFKWETPHDGKTIAAMIFGGALQGLGNAAAIQVGQAPHAQNEAFVAIDNKMKRDFEAKKAKYAAAGDALLMAKYGVTSAEEAHRAAMNDLNADFAARYKLVADQAEGVLKQQGVPVEQAKGNALVTGALEEQAKHEAEIHNREEGHRDQREQAAATLALARANLGERRREFDEGRINREADRKDKNAEKKAAEEQKLEVRDASGVVRGLAASPRVVKPTEDRIVQYDDAIKSVEDLIAYNKEHSVLGKVPFGDRYDRAVLAVAATTQANSSDKTTGHEAGTLKSWGLADPEAMQRTLEHLKKRQASFLRQLRPVEGGGEPAREDAPARGGEPAAVPGVKKPAATPEAGKDQAKIDRAWKTLNDPSQSAKERRGASNYLASQGQIPGG